MNFFRFIFIVTSMLLTILIFESGSLHASNPSDEFPIKVMFSKSDIPRIVENTRLPLFRDYWQSLLETDVSEDKNFMREAFIYAVTGDKKRGKLARKEMLEVLKLERWDYFAEDGEKTLGFLTAGRLTAWMCLGYDWIYDLLSPDERAEILHQIAEKGCVPLYRSLHGMRYPETAGSWDFAPEQTRYDFSLDMSRWPIILGNNNFRAVISGGLAMGIYTLKGKDERTEKWREMLIDSYYRFTELIEADGSYEEGVSYVNYAMTYLIYLMEVVYRQEGLDLFDGANYTGVVDVNLALFMPYHLNPEGNVNFGDSGRSLSSAVDLWVARKSRDGLSQYVGLNHAPSHQIFSMVYYDPTVKPRPPSPHSYFRELELDWIVTRTGYEMDDLVVAMRSGAPANHEHADRNSVILKYGGEILLADQYRPTYNPTKPDWLLRTSYAHNTVVIDGKGQPYHKGEEGTNHGKASAKIVRSGQRSGYDFWASDATPSYALENPDVESVTRTTIVFRSIPALIVIDKLIKSEEPSSFSARWFSENRDGNAICSVDGESFTIERPSAKFYAVCAGSPEVNIKTARLPLPDSLGIFSYVNLAGKSKSKEGLMIMAGVPLKVEEVEPEISIVKSKAAWIVDIAKENKEVKLHIFDREKLPEFEVMKNAQ